MTKTGHRSIRGLIIAGIVTAIGLTGLSAAAVGVFTSGVFPGGYVLGASSVCAPASLSGSIVNITLSNAGGPMMGQGAGFAPRGMMALTADRQTVSHGTVSFLATNVGSITHELVILPLDTGQAVGERPIASDGKVDEATSLGEASKACGADAGDGLSPGTAGWVTVTLAPGKYELVCNLDGHYQAGMFTELIVT